jgi:uncharacterized protein YndB with AHSA1/START domain
MNTTANHPAIDENGQSIVVDYDLARSPELVWRALTDPALLAAWLMENDIRPVVGHRFTFRARPVPGWDGVVHCEVLVVEPPSRLSYSWRGGSDEVEGYGSRLDTVVTWILTPTNTGGTHLRLEHTGFRPQDAFAFENMGRGWRGKVAQKIEDALSSLV